MPSGEPKLVVALAGLRSDGDQSYPCNQRNGAQDGGDRHGLLLFVRDLDGPGVYILVLVGEAEATGRETDNANQNENNSDDRCWFHLLGEPFRHELGTGAGLLLGCPASF